MVPSSGERCDTGSNVVSHLSLDCGMMLLVREKRTRRRRARSPRYLGRNEAAPLPLTQRKSGAAFRGFQERDKDAGALKSAVCQRALGPINRKHDAECRKNERASQLDTCTRASERCDAV